MTAALAKELECFGPAAAYRTPRLFAAREYCRRYARSKYENFSVVSLVLPRRLIPHFNAVYAFCRWADDLADESGGGAQALDLLAWWRSELDRLYEGYPRHPVMVALAPTIERFGIPAKPFLDLLFAFEQDQLVKRYATFDQLLEYCRHSADPVGRLVLYLFESFDDSCAVLSDRICTALQLTNFWQDVARDFDIGRVYLPEDDMASFGYSESDLLTKRFTRSFSELMRFEVNRTRDMYFRGMPLIQRLPSELRVDVELFARGGLAVLGKIERQGYNVWHHRPRLAKYEKAALMAGAMWRHWQNKIWPPRRPMDV
ncbi:MAG: squalene synthase HpnC [Gemmataceae bacterium]